MKKFAAIILSLLLVVASVVTLCACNKGGKYGTDTFKGAISDESYESEQDAIDAFLENELSGKAAEAQFVSKTDKGELSQKQIDQLVVDDELDEGDTIVSAKQVEVRYIKNSTNTLRAASADDEQTQQYATFTIYVIEISPFGAEVHEYRYYVPISDNGDDLTRSYYEDLFVPSKYSNCTQTYTLEQTNKVSSPFGSFNSVIKINYTLKIDGNKVLLDIDCDMTQPDTGSGQAPMQDATYYFEFTDDGVLCWASLGGEEYSQTYPSVGGVYIDDIDSFIEMFMPQQFDYSFYEKTNYGFKLQDGFLDKYITDALSQTLGDTFNSSKASLGIYVQNGHIGKMESSVEASISEQGASMSMSSQETLQFGSFGSTTVTRPAGIAD